MKMALWPFLDSISGENRKNSAADIRGKGALGKTCLEGSANNLFDQSDLTNKIQLPLSFKE